jgi:hypothetical protein
MGFQKIKSRITEPEIGTTTAQAYYHNKEFVVENIDDR